MAFERLAYARTDWTPGTHPLERKKPAALGRATLLRFEPGFEDPTWCEHGHAGYVVEGRFRLCLEDGVRDLDAGEGFVVEPGTRHRAANAGDRAVVVFVATYEASASTVSSSR
jgi:quercetin dioxygenase-like cupin family protein